MGEVLIFAKVRTDSYKPKFICAVDHNLSSYPFLACLGHPLPRVAF